jgi:lipopolysaccharide/colanic/teichoic acid biosynthesis glycosyltransferase
MKLKRFFDIVVASIGILIASPLMLLIAILIKMESRGPVLYRCARVGRYGKHFGMLKFRTMVDNADSIDLKLCGERDVRVTPFGTLLRRTKLNELPQLFNVLLGDMSLVGPRPEDPKFVGHYKEKWNVVLSVRPGVAGINQVLHRNEEDLFPPGADRETYYLEHILPDKLDRDIEYIARQTVWSDIALLTKALIATLFEGGIVSRLFQHRELGIQLLADLGFTIIAFMIAHVVRFETFALHQENSLPALGMIVAINLVLFPLMGLYTRSPRFFSVTDLLLLAKGSLLSSIILTVASVFLFSGNGLSRAVLIIYPFVLTVLLGASRIMHRTALEKTEMQRQPGGPERNVIIYGAGRLGSETLQRLKFEPGVKIFGFVDDDPTMRNRSIRGVKIIGTGHDLSFLKKLYEIDQVVIAFTAANTDALNQARHRCQEAGLSNALIVSSIPSVPSPQVAVRRYFRGIRFTDLLGIPEVSLDEKNLREMFGGTTVAVVGAGDHLGEHICRELLRLDIGQLLVVEDSCHRLTRINDAFEYINTKRIPFHSYFYPFGFHDEIKSVFKRCNVKWIIYNRPNTPAAAPLNEPVLFLTEFLETAKFVDMACRLGCNGFCLLSPYLKNCFCDGQRTMHLLGEHYLRVSTGMRNGSTKYGIMRLSNILENEVELVRRYYDRQIHDIPSLIPRSPMRFSSSRYAARTALNSMVLQNKGETFIEAASPPIRLDKLLEFYSTYQEQGGKMRNTRFEWESDKGTVGLEFDTAYAASGIPGISIHSKPELPDPGEANRLFAVSQGFLNPADKLMLKRFFSVLDSDFDFLQSGNGNLMPDRSTLSQNAKAAEHTSQ